MGGDSLGRMTGGARNVSKRTLKHYINPLGALCFGILNPVTNSFFFSITMVV